MSAACAPQEELAAWLAGQVADRAGIAVTDVALDEPFALYGLDSAALAAMTADLSSRIGQPVPVTAVFEYPTVGQLASALAGGLATAEASGPRPRLVGDAAVEPVAIVGLACRFPGAPGKDEYLRLLRDGRSAVREVPEERWSASEFWDPDGAAPGRTTSKWGGFVDGIDRFDAAFFGISAYEAARMDPQQRMLLETSWEALEDAGANPDSLSGSATGVFVGISASEYGTRGLADLEAINGLIPTGSALSTAANRISYALDLRGPSMAVDTACSSSLVATHLAVQAVRSGECDVALAAGVNAILDPELTIALSKAGMLAPDGRCKPFDAAANGYVRGEGCGVVVLKRLSDAVAHGDRVYAVVLGSAVNQDGRSNGLTAPNPAAQAAVLRAAYHDAQVDPAAVGYVECHGTGTALGDPVEVEALARVVGDRTGRDPCVIGSVKASIGHLESAAGIASLIKVALSLHHGEIFPSINVQTPNPAIPFVRLPVTVAGPGASWPGGGGRRLAGVSGFGFGGTNAHMVLAARDPGEPAQPERPLADAGPFVLPLAARTPSALAETARRWADRLREAGPGELAALLRTAATGRSHRGYRLAVTGATGAELADRLAAAADDRGVGAEPARHAPRVALVFSGQGGQWAGMGRALMRCDPLFASALRRCDEAATEFGESITGLLANASDDDLARTEIAQPVLVALQTALVTSLRANGVEATAVLGHSAGEIAAAWACGRLSLEAAMRVAALRGRAMAPTAGSGRMLAARLAPAEAAGYCSRAPRVVIAAVNSVSDVVFAGPEEDLAEIADGCQSAGHPVWWVPGRYPFHSPAMEEAAARLAADLGGLQPAAGRVPWYSTVHGGRADQVSPDAAYWAENVRRPVLLADALDAVVDDGVDAVVEVGPHGGLVSSIRRQLQASGHDQVRVLATLIRHQDDRQAVHRALAELFEIGCTPRWRRLLPGAAPVVEAPLYPWQRDRHWLARPERAVSRAAGTPSSRSGPLGEPADLAGATASKVWTSVVEPDAFFRDHRVAGTVMFPAAGYIELAVAAARRAGAEGAVRLRDVRFTAPLLLDVPQRVQTVLDTESHAFAVYARRADGTGGWREHARGIAVAADGDLTPPDACPGELSPEELSPEELYAGFAQRGLDYGRDFQALSQIRKGDGTAVARVGAADPAAAIGRICDPRLIDGCFQLVAAALTDAVTERLGGLLVPSELADLTVAPAISTAASGQARVRGVRASDEGITDVAIDLVGGDGQPLASIRGLRLAALAVPRPARFLGENPWLYEPAWEPRAAGSADRAASGSWLLLGDPDGTGRRLARELTDVGEQAVLRPDPDEADLTSLLTDLAQASRPLRGVVFLGSGRGTGEPSLPAEAQASLAMAVRLAQSLSFLPVQEIPGLWFVTRGAQPVSPADATDPRGAVLWGLAKAVPFENPVLACRCVDLGSSGDDRPDVAALAAELLHPSMETEIGFRSGVRHVRRLVPVAPAAASPRATVSAEGGYLITGGTGALGLAVAELLVARGARRIALVGRRGTRDAAAPALDRLRAAGAEVAVLTADVRDADAVADAVGTARRRFGSLRGVVHAAGVLADGPLLSMSEADLAAVAGPKVTGAWNLHQALAGDQLDWLVLFSSAAALLGSPGQANYCAANAFLDGLAHYRHGRGLPAISINWGPWARDGMAARGSSDRALRTAVNMLEPEAALHALELLLSGDHRQTLVMSFDLVNLVQYYPSGLGLPFFEALTNAVGDHLRSAGSASQDMARAGHLGAYVQPGNEVESRIAAILQSALGSGPVGAADGFFALGGDSVLGNQILIEVNRTFDVRIDAEQAFGDFTVGRLAELVNAALIARVEAMTEEEAAQYLRELG
jgi:acyl transferase domain-containing protein/acyl carrier protein